MSAHHHDTDHDTDHDGGPGTDRWIAVIGDRVEGMAPQDAIEAALADSASLLGGPGPEVRWIPTELLATEGAGVLTGAAGVWCAPGSPFRSMDGAVAGIRWAREGDVPFLGTCAGFQHGVIEFARNVLGRPAVHGEYGPPTGEDELFIDELSCSLVGEVMHVEIIDPVVVELYGTARPIERYYCRFGLNPACQQPLHDAGLVAAGVDDDGEVRVLRLAEHRFYLLTLFVPQTSSTATNPHPLVTSFLRAARRTNPMGVIALPDLGDRPTARERRLPRPKRSVADQVSRQRR